MLCSTHNTHARPPSLPTPPGTLSSRLSPRQSSSTRLSRLVELGEQGTHPLLSEPSCHDWYLRYWYLCYINSIGILKSGGGCLERMLPSSMGLLELGGHMVLESPIGSIEHNSRQPIRPSLAGPDIRSFALHSSLMRRYL